MNWLKVRLNKANFWNLMFLFGSIIVCNIADILTKNFTENFEIVGIIILLCSILIIPTLLVKIGKKFVNKNSNIFFDVLDLIIILFSTAILFGILLAYSSELNKVGMDVFSGDGLLGSVLFILLLPITLYFFIKNAHISDLFNAQNWNVESNQIEDNNRHLNSSANSISSKKFNSIPMSNHSHPSHRGHRR